MAVSLPGAKSGRNDVLLLILGFAALVAALVVALGWLAAERIPLRPTEPAASAKLLISRENGEAERASSFDPARFDRGRPLEIFIARHRREEER